MRALSPPTGACAVCGEPVRVKRPGEPGPAASYCSHACRQRAYERRHPLGWRLLAELGLEDLSLADMLRELGVDPFET